MADTRFARFVLLVNGAVPIALLGWDALHGHLGADPVNFAIHTTGWIALMFLTLSLLVTPLRKLSGVNWLVHFRRTLGLYGFFYAASHLFIYFWWDRGRSVSDTWHAILGKPFITYGFTALVLMVPLALTSTNGMIRWVGPKRWGWLHTLVYPATALAAIHYWLEGKVLTWDKKMFLELVGALLAYRWIEHLVSLKKAASKSASIPATVPVASSPAKPARPKFWSGELKIARIFRETPSVQTFRLTPIDGGPLPFQHLPGQYLNLSLMIDGKKVPRSYTIASAPTQRDYCEISVKREDMGTASRHLHDRLKEGETLKVSAPAGKFTFDGSEADAIVLIAGGVGITPLMSIARAMTDRCWKGNIDLFFTVRTPGEIIFAEEIARLEKRFANFKPHISVTRADDSEWTGLRGRITGEMLKQFVPDLTERLCFVCGPEAMLEPMQQLLRDLGVPGDKILSEAFVSPTQSESAVDAPEVLDAMPARAEAGSTTLDLQSMVTFQRSGKSAPLTADRTILDASEDCGVNIEYECRAGVCGTCKTKLLAGRVTMDAEDALSAADKSAGYILACQAHAIGDVAVDA